MDIIAIASALTAILMAGSTHLRMNLWLYSVQTLLIAGLTFLLAGHRHEPNLYLTALSIATLKAFSVPLFLLWIMRRINVSSDPGITVAAPLAMHFSVLLMGLSYFLTRGLPERLIEGQTSFTATASVSLLVTGLILMLTRRIALSQIIGFLVIENGIYLFAQTQIHGMPLVVEMGVLLDVLAGVMISGLLVFRIQRSFEHVDVTQLTDLKD
jgi:hydrogenase-4 component E